MSILEQHTSNVSSTLQCLPSTPPPLGWPATSANLYGARGLLKLFFFDNGGWLWNLFKNDFNCRGARNERGCRRSLHRRCWRMYRAGVSRLGNGNCSRGECFCMMFGVGNSSDFGSKFDGSFGNNKWGRKSLKLEKQQGMSVQCQYQNGAVNR